jgi:tRNA A-37 threonylcarbamoyl transferase component Bud32
MTALAAAPTVENRALPPRGGSPGRSVPADLLVQSCKRVHLAASVFAALFGIALLLNNILLRGREGTVPGLEAWPMPGNAVAAIGIALSVAMSIVAGRLSRRPALLLDLGLVYLVLIAGLVAFLVQWRPMVAPLRVSWVCVAILIYPALAPHTPLRTFVAALAAASMDPLFYALARSRGFGVTADSVALLWMFLPAYLCAGVAAISASVIRGLGQQVKEARELGSYRLGPRIGQGGMGDVHIAEHRLLARQAAVKLIRPDLLRQGHSRRVALERFRREASAAALLRSPHTIALYDYGSTPDGAFYYAMEYLDGVSFEDLVTRFGPLSAERAIHLMSQACESLAEAHARGLIHRDLKPSNIFTTRQGLAVDFVKVLDFGLVKFDHQFADRPATITAPEIATGTPAFMAPEAALGERSADHRTDIYSLGCVLYWLLTGQLVFEGESPMRVMTRHISDPPAPPSRRTELPIPPELDAVVLACLSKRAAERPMTALDLAERLAAVPLQTRWTAAQARRWWDTHLPERAMDCADCNEGVFQKQLTPEVE